MTDTLTTLSFYSDSKLDEKIEKEKKSLSSRVGYLQEIATQDWSNASFNFRKAHKDHVEQWRLLCEQQRERVLRYEGAKKARSKENEKH